MRKLTKVLAVVLILCLTLTMFAGCGEEAEYPSRDITYVIPFAAGGGVDVWGRQLAAGMAEYMGVNVTPSNVTGGSSGSTGVQSAWDAAHDGYTLCGTSETPTTIPVMTPFEQTTDDYEYFIAGGCPGLVCINADFAKANGISTMQDLIDYNDKASLNIAGTTGGLWYALSELLNHEDYGDLGFTFVPYDGSATAIAAAAGGIDAQLVAASSGEVAQYIEAGSLIALANMATEASGSIPSICDYLPELEEYLPIQQWLGFMVPADTDAEVLAALEEAFLATVNSASFAEFADAQAADIFALTGDEAKAFAQTSESKLCWLLYDLGAATYSPADSGIERS